jgi:hypothetical protein
MEVNAVDHILRAAGNVTGRTRFVLVGSAAIFAWRALVPPEMSMTREADLFAYDVDPETAESISDTIDGALGQSSQFDDTYGYYCDGVGPDTAILPIDWEIRAKQYSSMNTGGVVAIVPHPNDIALAKLCAGREKDMAWLKVAARHEIVDLAEMRERLAQLPEDRAPGRQILEQRLTSIESG